MKSKPLSLFSSACWFYRLFIVHSLNASHIHILEFDYLSYLQASTATGNPDPRKWEKPVTITAAIQWHFPLS